MFSAETRDRVAAILGVFLDKWIEKQYDDLRKIEELGISPTGKLAPFHDALVPGIRGLGERGFSTSLGNVHEAIAREIASEVHQEARRAYDLVGNVPVLAREFITQRVDQLERREALPDHEYEREQLLAAFGDVVRATTRIDLFVKANDGSEHYFEMKSAKPNKGQCREMKRRLLLALGIRRDANVRAWWGVPYNPYGSVAAYAHPYPRHYFDFDNEVMFGDTFWNFVGNDPATYDAVVEIYRDVGADYANRLDDLRAAYSGRGE